jgi:hypothetical protein
VKLGWIIAACLLLAAPAAANVRDLPGVGLGAQLAIRTWHLPCETLDVEPTTPGEAALYGYDLARTAGWAPLGEGCTIYLNEAWLRDNGESWAMLDEDERIARREHGWQRRVDLAAVRHERLVNWRNTARLTCAVEVHEAGHLSGYYDPVGVVRPDGTVDHAHSPIKSNVMYPSTDDYAGCDRLFRRPGA